MLSSLKRVYRASIDGFKSTSFHANVDHKPNTIVIIKPKNLECVFGGFSSVAWDSTSGYKSDEKAYLFIFGKKSSCIDQIMIKDSNKAIYCNHSYGPYFGNGDMIAITNNTQSIKLNEMTAKNFFNCCPNFNLSSNTTIYNSEKYYSLVAQEIEVFQ